MSGSKVFYILNGRLPDDALQKRCQKLLDSVFYLTLKIGLENFLLNDICFRLKKFVYSLTFIDIICA